MGSFRYRANSLALGGELLTFTAGGPPTGTRTTILGEGARSATSSGRIEAPGQLASHYAPGKPMRLGVTNPYADEFHIGFGAVAGEINLSVSADLAEAAANLYSALHAAADSGKPAIAVAPVPDSGIGAAINDRLRRAAA